MQMMAPHVGRSPDADIRIRPATTCYRHGANLLAERAGLVPQQTAAKGDVPTPGRDEADRDWCNNAADRAITETGSAKRARRIPKGSNSPVRRSAGTRVRSQTAMDVNTWAPSAGTQTVGVKPAEGTFPLAEGAGQVPRRTEDAKGDVPVHGQDGATTKWCKKTARQNAPEIGPAKRVRHHSRGLKVQRNAASSCADIASADLTGSYRKDAAASRMHPSGLTMCSLRTTRDDTTCQQAGPSTMRMPAAAKSTSGDRTRPPDGRIGESEVDPPSKHDERQGPQQCPPTGSRPAEGTPKDWRPPRGPGVCTARVRSNGRTDSGAMWATGQASRCGSGSSDSEDASLRTSQKACTEIGSGLRKKQDRRAHSGRKSRQTAAWPAVLHRCTAPQGCELGCEGASHTRPRSRAERCGAPEAYASRTLAQARRAGDAVCQAPKRTMSDAPRFATKRLCQGLEATASVPKPVRKDAPDARLCGRGWHDRWPPPVRATRQPVQASLRDAFARCQAAAAAASLG